MSDYFTEIFDDKISFNEDEFNNLQIKIKQGNWFENQENEAKIIIPNKKSWDKENEDNKLLELQTIKPIVGILNSIEGNGTLYLGIDTNDGKGPRNNKFEKIIPVIENIIKDKSSLQSLIYAKSGGNIGIYPNYSEPPEININSISCCNGNIFVVNVQRKDNNCVFYSKITNKIYKRYNDNTVELNLQEQITFIESKRMSRCKLKIPYNLNLAIINEGLKPTKDVACIIKVIYSSTINYFTINSKSVFEIEIAPSDACNKKYQFTSSIVDKTIYPKLFWEIGKFQIEGYGKIELNIATYDEFNYNLQNISFEYANQSISNIKENINYYNYM